MTVQTVRASDGTLLSAEWLRASDLHDHYRWNEIMQRVAPRSLRRVKYSVAMPNNNLQNTGPIVTMQQALEYHSALMRITEQHRLDHVSGIIMTVYYTNLLTRRVIEAIAKSPTVRAVKWYPPHKGATTGSGDGISFDDPQSHEILTAMQDLRVRLLIHGESVVDADGKEIPHALRESHFMQNVFRRIRNKYPDLLMCAEHISTEDAVVAVQEDDSGNTVATIAPQHAFCTDADFAQYGTYLKCMPIPKGETHRAAVTNFITSGDERAIMGLDDAPHPDLTKDQEFDKASSGCHVPHAIGMFVKKFEEAGAISAIEGFTSLNGPDFWGLPRPEKNDLIKVVRAENNDIPPPIKAKFPHGIDRITPLGWHEDPAKRMKVGYALL